MCSMTGLIHLLQTTVCGEVFRVIMSPSMWLHCKCIVIIIQNQVILKRFDFFGQNVDFLGTTFSNLSGLNLDGELSPSIGELKDLLTSFFNSLCYCFLNEIIFLFKKIKFLILF